MLLSIVLSAGAGTRMKSDMVKVLHKVCGVPMVEHVLDVADDIGCDKNVVVVGHKADDVKEALRSRNVEFALQKEQLGTGHAVKMAKEYIPTEGNVILLYGDTPLITKDSINRLLDYHKQSDNSISILTTYVDNPTGYGRIIRDNEGNVIGIIEEKDTNQEEKIIKEINSGIYCFKAQDLSIALDKINNNNNQGEYYITDTVKIFHSMGKRVGAFIIDDNREILGVNNRVQLAEAEEIMRNRINNDHMTNGVTLIDPKTTYIGKKVIIGKDTIIYPTVCLEGDTVIGEGCVIKGNSDINNSKIGNKVSIDKSTIVDSIVGEDTKVGPYAYLRPNSRIGKNVKIGDFVEVKNSIIKDNSKASHLAYIGDSEVGENVNIGCGTVFVNYDGKNKHKTIVGDNSFIGCNANLVAPVEVEDNAYVAAGSTITDKVPSGSLAIARSKQSNKDGWVVKKGLLK